MIFAIEGGDSPSSPWAGWTLGAWSSSEQIANALRLRRVDSEQDG